MSPVGGIGPSQPQLKTQWWSSESLTCGLIIFHHQLDSFWSFTYGYYVLIKRKRFLRYTGFHFMIGVPTKVVMRYSWMYLDLIWWICSSWYQNLVHLLCDFIYNSILWKVHFCPTYCCSFIVFSAKMVAIEQNIIGCLDYAS